MLHDDRVYEDPFTFNPDRFIDPSTGALDFTRAKDPEHACWGFGRRICPGRHMAFSAVWLAIASLVFCFDFEKAKVTVANAEGEEEERTVELSHEYIPALVQ
jgi:cytochrome P450